MRLQKIVCVAALFFLGMSGIQADTLSDDDKNKKETVIIPLMPRVGKQRVHRAPALIPLSVEYDGWSSALVVTFSRNVGDVTVELMNMTTGEYINRSLDGIGMASIPVSGSDGIYTINITLSSGTQYFGQFML